MIEYYPLIVVIALVCGSALACFIAYLSIKDSKKEVGFERNMKDGEITKRLLAYAKPYWKNFVLTLILMIFSISYDILAPAIVGDVEELVKGEFALPDLWSKVIFLGSILIVSIVSTYAQAMILQKTGQRIISKLREDLFVHIEGLSHSQLNNIPTGKLVTRITNDTNAISLMFTNIIVNMVKNSFVVVGVLVAMLMVNYYLTLLLLAFAPFIGLFTFVFRLFVRKAHRKVKDNTTDINTFLSENLSGMKVIQIFNREKRKQSEFEEKNQALKKSRYEQIYVFGVFRPLVNMLSMLTVLLLFYFGAKGYIKDMTFLGQVITGGTVVTFYMYIEKFYEPIQNLAEQFNRLQAAFASAEKIFSIMDLEPEVVDDPDAIEPEKIEGNIEFKNVWFAYLPDEWVLRDVSFTIKAGETAAFVGSTGSGKTTILSLICRNYDIQKGQILIDGMDIKKIKISALRKHFGQMLQDVFLFTGTIRSNILLRMEGVSDEEVMEACRYVNADHFINRLKNGLDEEVRERGNNFSAGQRQLLSFARTVLHKPSVMILDEATANIDTETELLIQDSLNKMRNIGTMLVVAHRLSTIQHADRIFVMSKGKIIEEGNHTELLAKQGRYYRLYQLQYTKNALLRGE